MEGQKQKVIKEIKDKKIFWLDVFQEESTGNIYRVDTTQYYLHLFTKTGVPEDLDRAGGPGRGDGEIRGYCSCICISIVWA